MGAPGACLQAPDLFASTQGLILMGAPLVLFVVIPILLLLLFGLVMVIRGLFFGAKKTAEGVEEQVEDDDRSRRGFFG
jgi:hypothetical protein